MSLYEQNLVALEHVNAPLHKILHDITELSSYEVYMEPDNVLSLNMVNTKRYTPLYSSNAVDVISEQISEFHTYQAYPYLYFFGVGNGMLLKQLLSTSHHKRIVVIEPDMEILYVVLNLVDFSSEIASGRLVFIDANSVDFPSVAWLLNTLETQRYARVYDLHVMTPYYEYYTEQLRTINKIFTETFYHMAMIAGNDTKDALIGLKHHITNLPKVFESFSLHSLFFKNDFPSVAVIVSTGPSLGKQLPLLKQIAPYVTVVAVDASLPILAKYGIVPDIVTSIERVPASRRFFEQTPQEVLEKIVCVMSSVQHEKVLRSVEKSNVIISLRPLAYMMLTGPREWGHIGIGMSSANMAYELVYHSHFKTCILIGQDLAYGEDGTSHTDGHVFGSQEVKYKESDSFVEAYGGGKKVRTTIVWNMFRGFFEKNIAEAKSTMETINATEGGARIYGALELPFEKAVETYVKHTVKKPLLLKKLSKEKIQHVSDETNAMVLSIESYVRERQKEIEALFLDIAHTCEKIERGQKIDDEVLMGSLAQIDTIREYAKDEIYQKVIWHIAQSMLFVQELSLASIEVRHCTREEEVYRKRVDLMLAYKAWLFCLAGCVDAILKTMTYAKGRSYIHQVETIGVYLEDVLIDTITCKTMCAEKGYVFDIDMKGILYAAPDAYEQSSEKIIFKDQTSAELPKSFITALTEQEPLYHRYKFDYSLQEITCKKKIEAMYCKNSIGFFAVEENLNDANFVYYLNQLITKFPDMTIKAFYFTESQRQMSCEVFAKQAHAIEYIIPKDRYAIAQNVEVIVCNEEKSFDRTILNTTITLFCHNIFVLYIFTPHSTLTLKEYDKILIETKHPLCVDNETSVSKIVAEKFGFLYDEQMDMSELFYWSFVDKALKDNSFKQWHHQLLKTIFQG